MALDNNTKIAIFALTRGYKDTELYSNLIKRNIKIQEHLLRIIPNAELILFHEGNISTRDQEFIINRSNIMIKFIDVREDFKKSKLQKKIILDKKFNHGYRCMCQFNYYTLWKHLQHYDFAIRVDEDVFIQSLNIKSLEKIFLDNLIFSCISLSSETHKYTNKTLPNYLAKVLHSENKNFYNHHFPYTNFYITKTDFWLSEEIQFKLKKIKSNPLSYIFRWGDLPVIGSFLNHYNININILENTSYYHASHNQLIEN